MKCQWCNEKPVDPNYGNFCSEKCQTEAMEHYADNQYLDS